MASPSCSRCSHTDRDRVVVALYRSAQTGRRRRRVHRRQATAAGKRSSTTSRLRLRTIPLEARSRGGRRYARSIAVPDMTAVAWRDSVGQDLGADRRPRPGSKAEFAGISARHDSASAGPEWAVGPTAYVQIVNQELPGLHQDRLVGLRPAAHEHDLVWLRTSRRSGLRDANSENDGDATVAYDRLANRWVIQQFSARALFHRQRRVSRVHRRLGTSDPTGAW